MLYCSPDIGHVFIPLVSSVDVLVPMFGLVCIDHRNVSSSWSCMLIDSVVVVVVMSGDWLVGFGVLIVGGVLGLVLNV